MKNQLTSLISKAFLLTTLVSTIPSAINAQTDEANKKSFKDGLIFTGALGYNGYFGDLSADPEKNILPFDNQTQLGFGLGIHKELLGFLEIGVKGMFGKVKEVNTTKRSNNKNVYTFESDVTQVGLNLNLNLVNLINKKTDNKFAFLLSGGYGITSYEPESSVLFPGGETGNFPASVNPNKGESSTEGTINYGLGVRYRFTDYWAVGLEANLYNVAADNLDSWVVNSSDNDSYSFVGISINYMLGKKKKVGNPQINKDKTPIPSEMVKTPIKETKEEIETVNEEVEEVANEISEEVVDKTPTKEEVKEVIKEKVIPPSLPALTPNDFKNDVIYFELNENVETEALNKQINAIASKLNKYPKAKVVLAGYTDKSGTEAFNNALSKRRADWVKNTLVSKYNISSSRISTVGKGFEGATKDIEPKNRKVEVLKVN